MAVKPFCARVLSATRCIVQRAFGVASQLVSTSTVARAAAFGFDNNRGACYAHSRLLLLS